VLVVIHDEDPHVLRVPPLRCRRAEEQLNPDRPFRLASAAASNTGRRARRERVMRKRTAIGAGAAGVLAAVALGGAALASGSGDDGEGTVTGDQADRATQAALEATNGGKANAVERDGENGATWEVEVTKTDGKTVDVRLDEHFKVVVIEADGESG
jgi:hypothetical protein